MGRLAAYALALSAGVALVGCAVGSLTTDDDAATDQDGGSSSDSGGSDATKTGDAPFDAKAACQPLAYCANVGDAGGDASPCADLTTDKNHCGTCTTACLTADAGALVPGSDDNPDSGVPKSDAGSDAGPWSLGTADCAKSVCDITCPSSQTLCADDICYDTQVFHEHCGDCNTACAAGEYCAGAHCCATGTVYCTSACVDIGSDKNNCGKCGNACTGTQVCSGGKCTSSCGATNEALTATATTSGGGSVSPYLPAEANDGTLETSSCSGFAWISAGTSAGTAWIQYTWGSTHTMTKMHMDTDGPTTNTCGYGGRTLGAATVEWWNGSSWVTDGTVSGQTNDWDYTFTSPVTTSQVRLYALYSTGGTGNPMAYEWQVFGCN